MFTSFNVKPSIYTQEVIKICDMFNVSCYFKCLLIECYSECLTPNEQCSAISWWEQITWDDNVIC